jgi:Na+/phosphate symporter
MIMLADRVTHIAVSACLLSLLACSSTAIEVPPQTAQGLLDMRSNLVAGKAQIQQTTDAARDLTQRPQAQIEPQINHLVSEVDALNQLATTSREQIQEQQSASNQYFVQWDSQLKTMTDSVRKVGEERRSESMASFETLSDKLTELRSTFRPYMDHLTEAAGYLKTDPTAVGVKSITPHIEEALKVEDKLMEEIDAVTAQIDKMRGSK